MLQLAIQLALVLSSSGAAAPVGSKADSGSPGAEVREERPPVLQLVEKAGLLLADNRKLLFGLYDDGTVIYASPRATWAKDRYHARMPIYFRARLSPEEKEKLLARLNPEDLHLLKESSFRGCQPRITLEPNGHGGTIEGCPTDGPTYFLVYRGGGRIVEIEIEYDLDPGPFSTRESLPASLVRIWDVLTGFSGGGDVWKPERALVTFLRVRESEISKEKRATIGCPWLAELADQFPSESELNAGKACRVLPASLHDATRDWIMKCWGMARPSRRRFVSVRVWDLWPGERPSSLPFQHRCRD